MFLSGEVFLIGHSAEALQPVLDAVPEQSTLSVRPIEAPSTAEALRRDVSDADALVFCVDDDWRREFWDLFNDFPPPRPPCFLVTLVKDLELLRAAMRSGIRDVFTLPLDPDDFCGALVRAVNEFGGRYHGARMLSCIGARGGSGTSFVLANLALEYAREPQRRPLLLDLDPQFGNQASYFSLPARDGLLAVLARAAAGEPLDLPFYTQAHASGVQLLASTRDDPMACLSSSGPGIERVLLALADNYSDVLVDVPRRIDPTTAAVLQRSEKILIVARQTAADFHGVRRLLGLLGERLGITRERLILAVNRHDPRAELPLIAFHDAFVDIEVVTIPRDDTRAAQAASRGLAVERAAENSPVGRAIARLAARASGMEHEASDEASGGLLAWLRKKG